MATTSLNEIEKKIAELQTALNNRPTSSQMSDAIKSATHDVGHNQELVTNERIVRLEAAVTSSLSKLYALTGTLEDTIKDFILTDITADDINDGIDKVMMLLTERNDLAGALVAIAGLTISLTNTISRVSVLESTDLDLYDEIGRLDDKNVAQDIAISTENSKNTDQDIRLGDIDTEQTTQNGRLTTLETKAVTSETHQANQANPHNVTKGQAGLSNVTNDAQLKVTDKGDSEGVCELVGGKVPVSRLPTGVLTLLGTWDADTNTPTLVSGVGVADTYYIVGNKGSTSLDGLDDWNPGDWAVFVNGTWNQVNSSDAVKSVEGRLGAVTLDDIYPLLTTFVDTSTGAPDAGRPVKTDTAGYISQVLLNLGAISHGSLADVGTHTHAQIDMMMNDMITVSQGVIDAGKHVGTNLAGVLDRRLIITPPISHGNIGTSFSPTIGRGVAIVRANVDQDFVMIDINITEGLTDGHAILFEFTQTTGVKDILSWNTDNFEGSDLIPLDSLGLSEEVGKMDKVGFTYDSYRGKWMLSSFNYGFKSI